MPVTSIDSTPQSFVKAMAQSANQSPKSIPPRRSSTGYHHHHQSSEDSTRAGLKTIPETSWMANTIASSSQHTHRRTNSSTYIDPALKSAYSSSFPQSQAARDTNSSQPPSSFNDAASTVIHEQGTTWSEEKERILMGPFDYMYDHPGKDIRKQMISAFNAWLKVPPSSLDIITKVVGMLHTASLLVDDVEDSSLLRRGVPVAHSLFGTAQTINSANYVYFAALQELLLLKNDTVIRIYTDELCNLHRGQGMDLFWRDTLTCPSEHDYLEMVGNKTGGLFRLAVLLMQAESQSTKDYIPLVNTVGLLFQIRDDYMNLCSSAYTETKGLCEDLTEGKFSFPIIHAIRANPSNLQLLNILKRKTTDEDVKRYAVKYMEKMGSFEYCKKVIAELNAQAARMIDDIDGGSGEGKGVKAILDKLAVS